MYNRKCEKTFEILRSETTFVMDLYYTESRYLTLMPVPGHRVPVSVTRGQYHYPVPESITRYQYQFLEVMYLSIENVSTTSQGLHLKSVTLP